MGFVEANLVPREAGALVFAVPHPFHGLFDPETCELNNSYRPPDRRQFDDGGDDLERGEHGGSIDLDRQGPLRRRLESGCYWARLHR